jgi:hypothetical protein
MTVEPSPVTAATRPTAADPGTLVHERDTGRVLRWTGRDWVDDLPGWLSVQLDEAEQLARAGTPGPWSVGRNGEDVHAYEQGLTVCEGFDCGPWSKVDPVFIAAHDPVWRLRDIELKRAILAEHVVDDFCLGVRGPCRTVRLLAEEFRSQPGWSDEWAA